MKKKLTNLIRGVAIIVVMAVVFQVCTQLLENKSAQKKYADFFESETNYDVIFLGTSHTLNTILPMEVWREAGISSYNWGHSNCTPAVNYYLIQDIVKYTDTKLVVLDLYGLVEYDGYGNGKYRTDRLGQQRVQFDELPFSLNKLKAAQDVFDDYGNNLDFVLNLGTYHNRWKELNKSDFDVELSPQKGADLLTGVGTGAGYTSIGDDLTTEIDSVCYDYFVRFLDFCRSENVAVLCLYLPFPANEDAQRRANSVSEIIEFYGADYVNMLNLNIVDYRADLYLDNVHLNNNGAVKVSRWLANYISQNYELDSYTNNQSWLDAYEEYRSFKNDRIHQTGDLLEKLSLTFGGDYTVELKINSQCMILKEDNRFDCIMQSLGQNGSITYTDELMYAERPCDVIIRVADTRTMQTIDEKGYVYADGDATPVET